MCLFDPQTDFIFYSRYKIKHIRQNSIDYLSFFVSARTEVFIDIIYMESGSSIKKTVKLELSGTDRMTAYNMSPVKISRLSGVQCDNIISYDARITNGTLTDLVRYVLDRQNHRECTSSSTITCSGSRNRFHFPDWYSTVRNWRGILRT